MTDPTLDYAREHLERHRLNLREHIRLIGRNEHKIMSSISHDDEKDQLRSIERALEILGAHEEPDHD